jgi:Holliday junction resolvasome RuvABC endonuclease subunit
MPDAHRLPGGDDDMTGKLGDFKVEGQPGQSVLRIQPPKVKKPKQVHKFAPVTEWYPNVLAFDQSLSSTGWAWLYEGVLVATGMLTTVPLMDPGFEDSFQRGVLLTQGIREVIDRLDATTLRPLLIAHEMPVKPNPRMKTRNREAGIVAAMAVRFAASVSNNEVVMLNAQDVRKVLCGLSTATKDQVREAVKRTVNVMPTLAYLNEHTYDAMAIAIVAAERKGQSD